MHRGNCLASEAAISAQSTRRAQSAVAIIAGKQALAAQRVAAAEAEAAHLVAEGRAEEAAAATRTASKWRQRADKAARVVQQAAKVVQQLEAKAMAAAADSPAVQHTVPVAGRSVSGSKESNMRIDATAATMGAEAIARGAAVVGSKHKAAAMKYTRHFDSEPPLLPLAPAQHEPQQQQQQQAVLNMVQPQSVALQPVAAPMQRPASSGSMAAGIAMANPDATCATAASSASAPAGQPGPAGQPAMLPPAGHPSSALSDGCQHSAVSSEWAALEQEAAPLSQCLLGDARAMPEPGASKGGRDALHCTASRVVPPLDSPLMVAASNVLLLDTATSVPVAVEAGNGVPLELNCPASTTYETAAAAALQGLDATTRCSVAPALTPGRHQPHLPPDFKGVAGESEPAELPRCLAVGSGSASAARLPSSSEVNGSAAPAAACDAAGPSGRAPPRPLPVFCSAIGPASAASSWSRRLSSSVAETALRDTAAAKVQERAAAASGAAAAGAAPAPAAPGAQPPLPASPLAERSLNALQAQLDRLERQLARSREQRARAERVCGARRVAGAGAGAAAGSAPARRLPATVTWLSGFARTGSDEAEGSPAWLRGFAGVTP